MKYLILALILISSPAFALQTHGELTDCFTLRDDDCALPIIDAINGAKTTLDVQAYNYTEPRIIDAIDRAAGRGVHVTVILDKISPSQKGEGADENVAAGIPVFIDHKPKIAHNKVMIIDGKTVVTGSFNFSTNADKNNAENVLIIQDKDIAADYADNFKYRLNQSEPYSGKK